jgi:hypothetical protein
LELEPPKASSPSGTFSLKNKFDQEETTDAWGFEKPSTSGISQTLKKGQKKSKSKSKNKNESDQEKASSPSGTFSLMLPSVLILTLLSKPSTSTFFSTWLTSCTRLVPLAPQVSPSQLRSKVLLTSTIHDTQAQLTKTLLLSCDGDTCGAKGTSLVQDVSQEFID